MAGVASSGFLVVATVRRPHGIRGELVLALETDRPKSVFRVGRALEIGDAEGRPLGRRLTVERTRPFKDGLLLKATEYEGRSEEVEQLRGLTLLMPASEAAPPAEDEIPYTVLLGSEVLVAGQSVGTVHEIVEAGGGEMLVVRRSGRRDLLVPFVKEMVVAVDVQQRRLELDPPEGLLDL